jgi:hypothetical protein
MDNRNYNYSKITNQIFQWLTAKSKILIFILILAVFLGTAVSCSSNSSSISSSTPYFPVQKPGMDRMEALMENVKLEMDSNGCLRAEGYLLIWPHGYSVRTEGEEVQIINDNGQVVACVGDKINVSGGEFAAPEEEARESIEKNIIRQKLPDCCSGPYWIVGETVERAD